MKYYRKCEAELRQLTRQLYTGDITELNIDEKTIGLARRGGSEECFRRIVGIRGISKCG
jgi:hypothetical protein